MKYGPKQIRVLATVLLLFTCLQSSIMAAAATDSQDRSASSGFGRITLLEGSALVGQSEDGPFRSLAQGALIRPGQILRTEASARLEIRFLDKSVVRLGPESVYQVETTEFAGEVRQRFSAKLTKGRMWAKVAPASTGQFQVRTPSAVISVRGTTYDLKAAADESTEVSVYDGRVGVAPPPIEEGADHEEFSWPEEVTEEQWEEIILARLQRIRIGADGKPGEPTAFAPDQEQDAWALWNQARDQAGDTEGPPG